MKLKVSGFQGAKQLHSEYGKAVIYKGMIDCFIRTIREEGIQALFKVIWLYEFKLSNI